MLPKPADESTAVLMRARMEAVTPKQYHGARLVSSGAVIERTVKKWMEAEFPGALFLHGGAGRGKTRMLHAIRIKLGSPTASMFFFVPRLFKHWQVMAKESLKAQRKEVEGLIDFNGFLLLDDLGAEKVTDFLRQEIYGVLHQRENWGKPIAFTSNLSIAAIGDALGERFASRLEGGTVIDFKNCQNYRKRNRG